MDIRAIVCIQDSDRGIGYNNSLLYKIPEDMKLFKELTMGNVVFMGMNTFRSLGNKPLKGRENIVITSDMSHVPEGAFDTCDNNTSLYFFINMNYALEFMEEKYADKPIYVIGGQYIYNKMMNCVSKIYITRVKGNKKADSFFPDFDSKLWDIESVDSDHKTEDGIEYSFEVWNKVV